MKKIINIVAVLVIAIAALYLWKQPSQAPGRDNPANLPTAPKVNIELVFSPDRQIKTQYEYTEPVSYSLFAITKEVATQEGWNFLWEDYGELGLLVTQIDQSKNGTDDKYWQYYVNGQMPQIGASNYYPKDQDNIKWIFQESQY